MQSSQERRENPFPPSEVTKNQPSPKRKATSSDTNKSAPPGERAPYTLPRWAVILVTVFTISSGLMITVNGAAAFPKNLSELWTWLTKQREEPKCLQQTTWPRIEVHLPHRVDPETPEEPKAKPPVKGRVPLRKSVDSGPSSDPKPVQNETNVDCNVEFLRPPSSWSAECAQRFKVADAQAARGEIRTFNVPKPDRNSTRGYFGVSGGK